MRSLWNKWLVIAMATCPSPCPRVDHTVASRNVVLQAAQGSNSDALAERPAELLELPGRQQPCSGPGTNCWSSMCCADPNFSCFAKDMGWAECKFSCKPGLDYSELKEFQTPWTCAKVTREALPFLQSSPPTLAPVPTLPPAPAPTLAPMPAPPVPPQDCAMFGLNCSASRCCRDPSLTCWEKDPGWATCKKSCEPGLDFSEPMALRTPWSCVNASRETLTTPATTPAPATTTTPAVHAAPRQCSSRGDSCQSTKCCIDPNLSCYSKHPRWAACRSECTPGIDPSEPEELQTPWDCELLEPDEPAPTEFPTVTTTTMDPMLNPTFWCFSLMLPKGYEVSLLTRQATEAVGIFRCEGHAVFSSEVIELRPAPERIATIPIEGGLKCDIGGVYHTALNSDIFVRVWEKVFSLRSFQSYEWTVKVDPDAVFLPDRLRQHVSRYLYLSRTSPALYPGDRVFLNNCKDGLHGPIEVVSRGGMEVFSEGIHRCRRHLQHEFATYGEDVFLRHCLKLLEVSRGDDFGLLTEVACDPFPSQPMPCISGKVSFHPLKSPEAYFECLGQAEPGKY